MNTVILLDLPFLMVTATPAAAVLLVAIASALITIAISRVRL